MATRFYIPIATPEYTPPTLKGNWFSATGFVCPLSPAKFGDQINTPGIAEGIWEFSLVDSALVLRAVSDALQAQLISGMMDFLFGVVVTNPASHYNWHVHAYVTVGDTDAVRGILLNSHTENANQWPIVPQTRSLQNPVVLNPVAAQTGDRIVLEVGFVSRIQTNPEAMGFIWVGAQRPFQEGFPSTGLVPAPDLVAGGNLTLNAGHVDFSQNIVLVPKPAVIEHTVVQVVKPAPPAPTEVMHYIIQVVQPPPVPEPAQISHMIIQVVPPQPPPLPDLSGLYFLNRDKVEQHDSYYNSQELKIPDPTIRTALLGE